MSKLIKLSHCIVKYQVLFSCSCNHFGEHSQKSPIHAITVWDHHSQPKKSQILLTRSLPGPHLISMANYQTHQRIGTQYIAPNLKIPSPTSQEARATTLPAKLVVLFMLCLQSHMCDHPLLSISRHVPNNEQYLFPRVQHGHFTIPPYQKQPH